MIQFLILLFSFITLWAFFAFCFEQFKKMENKLEKSENKCEEQTKEKRIWRSLAENREKELKKLKKQKSNMQKWINKHKNNN